MSPQIGIVPFGKFGTPNFPKKIDSQVLIQNFRGFFIKNFEFFWREA